ncbi:MAG: hypothetical protein QW745_08075 [Thermoplasmata archaeon]|uniref:hypothetical protein n=1 Tax=Metallosphaera sp. TaxID=2020860 RepID=UPI0031718C7A
MAAPGVDNASVAAIHAIASSFGVAMTSITDLFIALTVTVSAYFILSDYFNRRSKQHEDAATK